MIVCDKHEKYGPSKKGSTPEEISNTYETTSPVIARPDEKSLHSVKGYERETVG